MREIPGSPEGPDATGPCSACGAAHRHRAVRAAGRQPESGWAGTGGRHRRLSRREGPQGAGRLVRAFGPMSNPVTPSEPTPRDVTLYELLGGETGVRALVDRFYDLMAMEPDFADLLAVHPQPLDRARDKLFWFLSGWSGGPDLFVERFGHPRLKMRHMPYPIGIRERDQWVACMGRAMVDQDLPEWLRERLLQSFFATADWMRNKAG